MKLLFKKLWISILGDKSFARIIGIIFLVPPILSVLFFLLSVCGFNCDIIQFECLSESWKGNLEVYYAPEYSAKAGDLQVVLDIRRLYLFI